MVHRWLAIAKAEFNVQMSGRKRRVPVMLMTLVLGVFWALALVPILMEFILTEIIGISSSILVLLMPQVLRAGLMLIWFILLLYPLTNALKEVRIGQWEILIANSASSRDIFLGTFLGKLPVNGLIVLYLAPVLISPFVIALEIAVSGQILIYGTIAILTLGAIWLSDFLVTFAQARLGGSERGRGIASAMAILLGMVTILPLVGFQLFASQMLEIFSQDIFLWFPFTWSADLITAIAHQFMGVGSEYIPPLTSGYAPFFNLVFLLGYTSLLIIGSLLSINRLILLNTESGKQSTRKITSDSALGRGLRKLTPGTFGSVILSVMKVFTRTPQNLARLGQMIGMSLFLPILIGFVVAGSSGEVEFMMVLIMVSLAFALLSGQTFGATGFLESRDQLWLLQSIPHGTSIFIRARLVQTTLFLVPCAMLSSLVLTFVMGLTFLESVLLFLIPFAMGMGSALVAIGVTASNPIYDETNSATLKANITKFMVITLLSFMLYTILDMVLGIVFGLGGLTQMVYANTSLYMLVFFGPLPVIGSAIFIRGTRNFNRLE
ncbi:MAG: hypothetical protein ACFFEJ_11850 [Candidatus Thorarchaeota archaeon]